MEPDGQDRGRNETTEVISNFRSCPLRPKSHVTGKEIGPMAWVVRSAPS